MENNIPLQQWYIEYKVCVACEMPALEGKNVCELHYSDYTEREAARITHGS